MYSNHVSLFHSESQQNAVYKPVGNKENHSAEPLMNHFWKISHYSTTKNSQQQPSEESSVFLTPSHHFSPYSHM